MAIEYRALVALSVAFIASIVVLIDVSAGASPGQSADGDLFFGPFEAFLLPVAAVLIWWLLSRLHRAALRGTPDPSGHPDRTGPATALFLSAFHVTVLVGLVGAYLWPARMLGLIVGGFLIATGNELPRLRTNPLRAFGASLGVERAVLWRRVSRIAGYVRVLMGAVIGLAALAGTRGFAQLIPVAVALELLAYAGAAVFLAPPRPAES
jgi:hypothetical protein